MLRELSLFTGAGGGLYASILLGWRTVCAVEFEPHRREIIRARQRDGIFEPFPVFDDVRTFAADEWRGRVDVVSGGFPCQPHSLAGKRRGGGDERNLWPEMLRIIRAVRPRFVFGENVPGILGSTAGDPDEGDVDETAADAVRYFGVVLGDLADVGYDAEWCRLGALSVGAPHIRNRIWFLAYLHDALGKNERLQPIGLSRSGGASGLGDDGAEEPLAHRNGERLEGAESLGIRQRVVSVARDRDGQGSAMAHAESERTRPAEQSRRGDGAVACGEVADADEASESECRVGGNPNGLAQAEHGDLDAGEEAESAEGHSVRCVRCGRENSPEFMLAVLPAGQAWCSDCWPALFGMWPGIGEQPEWEPPRVIHGQKDRRHRLAALGDGHVPLVAAAAFGILYDRAMTSRGGSNQGTEMR